MARQYKAAGADLLFASAETFSLQYPIKWLHAGSGPKLFFLKAGSATPEQLEGQLTVSAAVSFINSKLSSAQHRITAPPEPEETVSDPIPEKWDGPVKRIVAKNFDERVLNSDKVGLQFRDLKREHHFKCGCRCSFVYCLFAIRFH